MKKKYIFTLAIIGGLFFSLHGFAQTNDIMLKNTSDIEDLSIVPNPVSQGKIYINSKTNDEKRIDIYNVLGKNILSVMLFGEELNVSKLKAGVYVIKITENNISSTRKLVIR